MTAETELLVEKKYRAIGLNDNGYNIVAEALSRAAERRTSLSFVSLESSSDRKTNIATYNFSGTKIIAQDTDQSYTLKISDQRELTIRTIRGVLERWLGVSLEEVQ